jgi:putative ABC transport system permease protein
LTLPLQGWLRVSYRNLARNRRRNLATGAAIALGFAALLALGGYINRTHTFLRIYTLYASRTGHVSVYKKGGLERYALKPKDHSLTPADQDKIKRVVASMKGVDLHGPQLTGAGLIGNGCKTMPFLATGLDPELDKALRQHPEMANWITTISQYQKGRGLWEYGPERGAVALAGGLARLLGKSKVASDFQGDPPLIVVDCTSPDAKAQLAADTNVQLVAGSWSGMMNAVDGEVVAHYNTGVTETNGQAILLSLQHLQRLYDTENVTYWSIWIKDDALLPGFMNELSLKLRAVGADLEVYPWTDERISPFYSGTLQFLNVMIGFLTMVLSTVVVFSVFNAATMTVIERSQEIGMMRSLGYTKRGVRILFVIEMALLTGMSLFAGGIIAFVGILSVNGAGIELHPPGIAGGMLLKLTPSALTVAFALALITVLALVTTWFAVKSVARRNIASLLLGMQR